MKNYFHVDFASKSYLVVGMMIFMLVLSACGSPTTAGSTLEESMSANSPTAEVQVAPAASLSYSKDVYPIFEASCVKCHGVEKVSRGLDLTSYEKTMTGSVKGPVVLPGDAENSLLVKLTVEGKMPKQGAKLTPEQVEIVRNWVNQGAPNN